jgi:hypothetical protein
VRLLSAANQNDALANQLRGRFGIENPAVSG